MSAFALIPPVTNSLLATMAQTTIKGRALADGGGVPLDLTAAQIAAIVGSVGGALKSQRITITRDLTVATGSVAYTGVGFQPTAVVALGNISASLTQYTDVISIADSSRNSAGIVLFSSVMNVTTNFLQFFDTTATNGQTATISSYDADGLTLSWTKTATPSGTVTAYLFCFR